MNQIPTGFVIGGVAHPVDFLRDGKGIYGIGLVDGVDGVDELDRSASPVLLRPDRLDPQRCIYFSRPIYQMITGGFRHGMFSHTFEEGLAQTIDWYGANEQWIRRLEERLGPLT